MKSHMSRFLSFTLTFVMCLSLAPVGRAAEEFSDVPTDYWGYNDISECASLGIVSGFEDGSFRPEDDVTDVQFIVMLTRTFYNDEVGAARETETPTWYAPNMKVAKDASLTVGATIEDKAMNRYNTAEVLTNTILSKGKTCSAENKAKAAAELKDWNSVPKAHQAALKICYGHGIITGMSDGTFSGNQSMTRAQACTVIMRMLKLINNYNPGDKDNDQYDDGQSQTSGQKLANGKDITVDNVLEIIEQIKREYPVGTVWGAAGTPGNHTYPSGGGVNTDMYNLNKNYKSVNNAPISLTTACGGFACMVTERIFGKTGFPFREVTRAQDCRPGDIIVQMNAKGQVTHYGVVMTMPTSYVSTLGYTCWSFDRMDGNLIGSDGIGRITWQYGSSMGASTYTHVFTRYPEGLAELSE